MAIAKATSITLIKKNQHWEDYKSLKRYFSARGNAMTEVMYHGVGTTTAGDVEFLDGSGETIAFLAANDIVYAAQEADTEAFDGKTIWIDYISSTGDLYEAIPTVLDSDTSTATEVPIGCIGTPYVEAIASRQTTGVTMTAIVGTIPNQYVGWYVVACGDATDQEGASLLVTASTATDPVVLTTSTVPNANWAADNVSLQPNLYDDVYRIRRAWTETEGPAGDAFWICDKDATNKYCVISDDLTYGSPGSRYTALDTALYRSFLGKIHITAPKLLDIDADDKGLEVNITFTPLPETGQTAADITLKFDFVDEFLWEPCIELAEGTDVIITQENLQNVVHGEMKLDFTCLEVTI